MQSIPIINCTYDIPRDDRVTYKWDQRHCWYLKKIGHFLKCLFSSGLRFFKTKLKCLRLEPHSCGLVLGILTSLGFKPENIET